MKTKSKIWLLLLALLSIVGSAYGQGTAIGYQGRLNNNGTPAIGLYDFTFSIYDSQVNGNLLAGPIAVNAVPVTNGLFNVALEFGPNIFTGAGRWLETSVRANGGGALTLLAPRNSLLPTPYSIFAASAASVPSGAVAANQLNTGGVAPTPGQFLSYDGGNLAWRDPGVSAGDIFSRNGTSAYYNGGNVGIGTATPVHRLSLSGGPAWTANGWTGAIALPNAAAIAWHSNAGGQRFGIGPSTGGLYFFRSASDPGTTGSPANYDLQITDNGNLLVPSGRVGIGTSTPTSKLTVRTTGAFSAYGIEHTDGNVRLSTYLDAAYGAWLGTRSVHGLNFYVGDGLPSMAIDTSGNIIMTPNGGSGGYGSTFFGTPNGESGLSIKGNNRADVRFNGSSLKLVAATGVGPPPSEFGIAVHTSGNVGIGTTAPAAKLDVRGTTRTCVLTITGGCDLAEPFKMKDGIEKGSVVVIDPDHPGQLKLSGGAYDTRVAGIVSGANGVNTGISLQQEGLIEGGQNVALSGRVYVRADTSAGPITPGDLLTTSDTPGHAMKVGNHSKAQGAILGKAMTALADGKGMVLVLVTLQ